jgi:hypothetical protein
MNIDRNKDIQRDRLLCERERERERETERDRERQREWQPVCDVPFPPMLFIILQGTR